MAILPVTLIGTSAVLVARNSLEREIKRLEEGNTRAVADKITLFLRERYGDIQVISNLDFLTNPNLQRATLVDEKAKRLDAFIRAYEVYDSISVFDLKGDLVVQTRSQGTPLVKNQTEESYFQAVLASKKAVISQPFVDQASRQFSIYVAAPVKSQANGQIIGVVRARIPVRFLEQVLSSRDKTQQDKESRSLYLVNPEGNIFASSSQLGKIQVGQETIPATSIVPNYASLQAKEESQTTLVGSQFVTSYVPLETVSEIRQDLPNLGWVMISTVPQSVAFAPQRSLESTLTVGTLLAIAVVSIFVVFLARRVSQPIVEAAQAVSKIGEGDLQARLSVQGEDEIAQLGNNINSMAEQIQSLLQEQALSTQQSLFLAEVASTAVSSREDLNPLFSKALGGARDLLGVDRLLLYYLDSGAMVEGRSETIVAESLRSGQPSATAVSRKIEFSPDLLQQGQAGEAVATSNVVAGTLSPDHQQWLTALNVKASLEAPLLAEGKLAGFLMVHDCQGVRNWQPQTVNFFRQLANQLETAMNRVSALEQIQKTQQEAEKLAVEQTNLKESLQRRALELLMEVDPVSQGDLTIRAKVTEDEIGTVADSYNATIESLRKIVSQVQRAVQQVATTASNSEAAVETLSSGATVQTQEIAATLQRIQDMVESIRMVAASAQQAETAVQAANQTVQEGDTAMNRTVEGILAIRETVGETAKKVKRLGESSQKISKVVNLISTFAAQTNLLALNASIEAARAGEEGRGFAVVADEVRSLARQSAEATAEIEKLVAGIQAETQEVVAAMESGTEQVVLGTKLVDETRQSLNQISAASAQIRDLVDSIAQAASEQSHASEAVTQTMTGLANIAAQTSTEAGQVSESFKQLLTVAQTLQEEVARFKVS
jgi:methyl-accepting chemotaxis protein